MHCFRSNCQFSKAACTACPLLLDLSPLLLDPPHWDQLLLGPLVEPALLEPLLLEPLVELESLMEPLVELLLEPLAKQVEQETTRNEVLDFDMAEGA